MTGPEAAEELQASLWSWFAAPTIYHAHPRDRSVKVEFFRFHSIASVVESTGMDIWSHFADFKVMVDGKEHHACVLIAKAEAPRDDELDNAARHIVTRWEQDFSPLVKMHLEFVRELCLTAHCSICGIDRRPGRVVTAPGDLDDGVLCCKCDTPENEARLQADIEEICGLTPSPRRHPARTLYWDHWLKEQA